jgi:lincosamide nucleotidyltransferase A/C/D/E
VDRDKYVPRWRFAVTPVLTDKSGRAWYLKAMRRLAQGGHHFVRNHRSLEWPLGWFSMRVGFAPESSLGRLLGSWRAYIRGEMDASEVHRVLEALDAADLRFWLAGGWGVDALIGVQSRTHDDLDIVLEDFEAMEPDARKVMESLGYAMVESHRDEDFPLPRCSTFDDGEGHRVQLVSLAWRSLAAELGLPAPAEGDGPLSPALVEVGLAEGTVEGRCVPCVSIKVQQFLSDRYVGDVTPKHRRDFETLKRANPEPR